MYENFKIERYHKSGTYLVETDGVDLNNWKTKIPEGDYDYVGRSHELKPELVEDLFGCSFEEYFEVLKEKGVTVNYSDNSDFWAVLLIKG